MRVELDTCGVPPVDDSDDQSTFIDSQSLSASPRPDVVVRLDFFRSVWKFTRPDAESDTCVAVADISSDDLGVTPAEFMKLPYSDKKSAAYEKARRMAAAPGE